MMYNRGTTLWERPASTACLFRGGQTGSKRRPDARVRLVGSGKIKIAARAVFAVRRRG